MKYTILIFAVFLTLSTKAQIVFVGGPAHVGLEHYQWTTTGAATYSEWKYTVTEKEAGHLEINYSAVNTSTGASVNKKKIVGYKMVSGVITLSPVTNLWAPTADAGMTTLDPTITAVGSNIQINIISIAATIRHTIRVQVVTSLTPKL